MRITRYILNKLKVINSLLHVLYYLKNTKKIINLRILILGIRIRQSGSPNWKRLMEYI